MEVLSTEKRTHTSKRSRLHSRFHSPALCSLSAGEWKGVFPWLVLPKYNGSAIHGKTPSHLPALVSLSAGEW